MCFSLFTNKLCFKFVEIVLECAFTCMDFVVYCIYTCMDMEKLNICNIPLSESEEYDIWLILSMYSLLRVSLIWKGCIFMYLDGCLPEWIWNFVSAWIMVISVCRWMYTWMDMDVYATDMTIVGRMRTSVSIYIWNHNQCLVLDQSGTHQKEYPSISFPTSTCT